VFTSCAMVAMELSDGDGTRATGQALNCQLSNDSLALPVSVTSSHRAHDSVSSPILEKPALP